RQKSKQVSNFKQLFIRIPHWHTPCFKIINEKIVPPSPPYQQFVRHPEFFEGGYSTALFSTCELMVHFR
ncbi:MAG: hypothetical protein PVF98_14525, partial [Desulfobacterales bacterium]